MAPEYFKFHLRPYEAELYIEGLYMRQRSGWEQARLIVSPWSGKDSSPIVFPWENDKEQPQLEELTKEALDELHEWSGNMLKKIH